jgi:hypothetical protein
LEQEKSLVTENQEETIHHLESYLPPLRGHSASVIEYAREQEEVEERLKSFYSGDDNRFKGHGWDMSRAKQVEYQLVAGRLLNIVRGSLGRRIEVNKNQDPILIGVGLSQFSSNIRQSSPHSTFLSYFKTVRYFIDASDNTLFIQFKSQEMTLLYSCYLGALPGLRCVGLL